MVELEDLKNTWVAYDKKLSDSLKLNEELLKKMNLDKSSRELNKLLVYEQVGLVILFGFLIYILLATFKLSGEPRFFIPGIITSVFLGIMAWFSVKKVVQLSKIDYSSVAVLKLQELINKFNATYIKLRKWEFAMLPVFCVSLIPILWKSVKNFDAYEHIHRFGFAIGLGTLAGYATGYWIYYKWYDKKIRKAQSFLKELEQYNIE